MKIERKKEDLLDLKSKTKKLKKELSLFLLFFRKEMFRYDVLYCILIGWCSILVYRLSSSMILGVLIPLLVYLFVWHLGNLTRIKK